MRKAHVYLHGILAGTLTEENKNGPYHFLYDSEYTGRPISLTMPVKDSAFSFSRFPPFFDGLLPEGILLDGLLTHQKMDRFDYFKQLITVGNDLVGAVTVLDAS